MNIEELNRRLKDVAFEYLTDEQKLLAAYTSGYNDGVSQCDELKEPVEKMNTINAPKLSRFLPEGWRWVWDCDYPYVKDEQGASRLCPSWYKGHWNNFGLLHPSEGKGGGFQRHKPGDKLPDGAQFLEESGIVGWRPPFEQNDTK